MSEEMLCFPGEYSFGRVLLWVVNHKKHKSLQNLLGTYHFVELFTLIILPKNVSYFHQQMTILGENTKSVRLLEDLTFFSILTLAPSFVDAMRKLFLAT
jgi:hypothetical protein